MTPSDENVIFFDDSDWVKAAGKEATIFGGWNYRGGSINCISKRNVATFATSEIVDNEYEFSFATTGHIMQTANKATGWAVKDSNGNVVASIVLVTAESNKADLTDSYITVGDFQKVGDSAKVVTGFTANSRFSVKVNKSTGAVTVSYNDKTTTGTIEGVGNINQVVYAPDGRDKQRMSIDGFTISKVQVTEDVTK